MNKALWTCFVIAFCFGVVNLPLGLPWWTYFLKGCIFGGCMGFVAGVLHDNY